MMNLIDLLTLYDKDITLLDDFLGRHYGISIPALIDDKNIHFKNICILKSALDDLGFNDNSDLNRLVNYSLFSKCFDFFSEIASIDESLFICEQIINNYLLGVDQILKHELTKDLNKKILIGIKDYRVAEDLDLKINKIKNYIYINILFPI